MTVELTLAVLSCLGFPALMAAAFRYLYKQGQKNREDNDAVKLGVQALLRAQMIADYNKYHDLGYAPIYARDNFENCWAQYHSLGANGVMDDIHMKFLDLPTEPEENK